MDKELDVAFWNNRWATGQTGWDIGYASPAITTYLQQYENKNAAILIPGCGNAHEAEFLISNGFTNITLIDIAFEAVSILREKFKTQPQVKIICDDFFNHQGKYDLIIEQTFFCALSLEKRAAYVQHMASLLNNNGKLIGLLFSCYFEKDGPPFGGTKSDYQNLFEPHFKLITMEPCYNSIPPRNGNELFFILRKK
ncbi:MAG TPA: methyltransferase domain-containing protein [Chitinophagaceae bacterium]|nr:methyltransferase domain-containing protein [Chitinophagaceae bacterium]